MFYCPVCNSGIAVNVSKSFRILASAAISSKKFSIGSLSLTLVAKAGAPEFWCPTCDRRASFVLALNVVRRLGSKTLG
jgi:hypothetical protein